MVRRTKRRFAHELYPLAGEWDEPRALEVEVPCQYARALGLEVFGTDWSDLVGGSDAQRCAAVERTAMLIEQRRLALLLDALLQGLCGQEAYVWADERARDESGEIVGERAIHYGVDVDRIRPYPVLREAQHHQHWTPRTPAGVKTLIGTVPGPESECPQCTEEVEDL